MIRRSTKPEEMAARASLTGRHYPGASRRLKGAPGRHSGGPFAFACHSGIGSLNDSETGEAKLRRLAAVTTFVWLVVAAPAWAVDATCQDLQDKLDDAGPNETITLGPEGTRCDGNYFMSEGVTLEGAPNAGFQPDSEDSGYSLTANLGGGPVTLRNLVFLGPEDGHRDAGGAHIGVEGPVTVQDSTFQGIDMRDDSTAGAALHVPNATDIVLRDNVFGGTGEGQPNFNEWHGGAAYLDGSDILLESNEFIANEAGGRGGGLYANASDVTARDNTFTANKAGDSGGGAHLRDNDVTLVGNEFTDNESTGSGGGVYIKQDDVLIEGNTFTHNKAERAGGGARVRVENAVVIDNTFDRNESGVFGGGLALSVDYAGDNQGARAAAPEDDADFTDGDVRRNVFTSNKAIRGGGGMVLGKLYEDDSLIDHGEGGSPCCGGSPRVEMEQNVYDLNEVSGSYFPMGGGAAVMGIFVDSFSERYIRNTVTGTAPNTQEAGAQQAFGGEGGGLAVSGAGQRSAEFRADNMVVAGNQVADGGYGAGIYTGAQCGNPTVEGEPSSEAEGCGTHLQLHHATVAGNVIDGAGDGTGIGADPLDSMVIRNSIVYGNKDTDDESIESEITGTEDIVIGYSDVCSAPGTPWASPAGEPNICADPLLVGPTEAQGADVHQTNASPTIDAAPEVWETDIGNDYEGDPRAVSLSDRASTPFDMGADEHYPAEFGVAISDGPDPLFVGESITYTVTVDNNGPGPAKDVVTTITLPFARTSGADGCTGTTTLTCTVASLDSGASQVYTVVVRAASAGAANASASVASASADRTADDHNAGTTTTVNNRPSGGGLLPDTGAKACGSRRNFRITLRRLSGGDKILSARVRVNGKPVKVVRRGGRFTATVRLGGLPKGRFTVNIVAKTKQGKTLRGKRVYRTCTKKRATPKPPL
jgi:hypothetical protein